MKIGEVSEQLAMPASTIRYYEKQGLINSPERVSGQREFNSNNVIRLRFIQLCQAAGFSIGEIKKILEQYKENSSQDGLWQPAVEKKQQEIRNQIDELKQMEIVLNELMQCRCETVEQCVSEALQDSRWKPGRSE